MVGQLRFHRLFGNMGTLPILNSFCFFRAACFARVKSSCKLSLKLFYETLAPQGATG